MAPVAPDLGKTAIEGGGGEERGKGGRDEMFQLKAELVEVCARSERPWSGLFIELRGAGECDSNVTN